ncbi:hypothetical protein [Pseudomonas sp. MWU12-2323]|uniref:hypothetical protein n=1 Tax=Pseudomonas sp. MWU12-2323 TaxID=2651296 RepID=UPI00128CB8BA|nr:hypothetical protein [Pseudomonas sp. MWU12-2323]MPQ69442.1 hypothetical protein [Pseudomonas sp. MWU12-2323]
MSVEGRTKNVRINLSAFKRVEYSEVIQVPINTTDDELQELANRRYTEVDGGEFSEDPDYWDAGTVECVTATSNCAVDLSLVGDDLVDIRPSV